MPPRLQLVVPCFNEAARLRPEGFLQLLESTRDTGLIFVDDGSTDATPAVLAGIAARSGGKASVLTEPRNLGKSEAIRRGMLAAFERAPALAGYWDADLSTPFAALPSFIEWLDGDSRLHAVIGARVRLLGRRIDRRAARHYAGRVFATAASIVLGAGVYDTQCGAKIFRVNDTIRQVFAEPFQSRWIVDVEILARYLDAAGPEGPSRIRELPLEEWTDVPGSKLGLWHGVRALWDLARLARR